MCKKIMCRMTFDLEREESVPKALFRKLIMYPAIDLDVKGEMVEARPNYYQIVAEGEHVKLNEYTVYINGVTRVVAVLHPGQRECNISPTFTGEFVVHYIKDSVEDSVPNAAGDSSVLVEQSDADKKDCEAVTSGWKENDIKESVPQPAGNSRALVKKSDVKKKDWKQAAPKKSQSKPKKKDMTGGWKVIETKGNLSQEDQRGIAFESDDEASLTMEPVDLNRLRQQTGKEEKAGTKRTLSSLQTSDSEEMESQCLDWPETELYEESQSILTRRKQRK